MRVDRPMADARVFAETSASVSLDEVCRWLSGFRSNQLQLDVDDLPAIGRRARLRLALPVTARRAVLCAVSLIDDAAGGCLLSGQLRFVAHPTASDINVSFHGHTTLAMTSDLHRRRAHHAVGELLHLIAESLRRSAALTQRRQVAI